MYTINKILVTDRKISSSLSDTTGIVKDLLARWTKIIVVLVSDAMDQRMQITLTDYPELNSFTGTVEQFIQNMDLAKYIVVPYQSKDKRAYVNVHDAIDNGWDIDAANALANIATLEDDSVPKHDLLLRRPGKDYIGISRQNLVSVNGLIHPISGDENGIYVLRGKDNCDSLRMCNVQFIDFSNIGNVRYLPIDDNTIMKAMDDVSYYSNGVYIKIPEGMENHTLLLSFCGHLHALNDTITYFDKNIVRIDIRELSLEPIILEFHKTLGLSDIVDERTQAVNIDYIRKDLIIRKILNQINTFLIAVDCKEMYKEVSQVDSEELPGTYSYQRPLHGIVHYSDGRVVEYLQKYEDGRYCINVPIDRYNNYRHYSTDWEKQKIATKARVSVNSTETDFLYVTDLYKLVN